MAVDDSKRIVNGHFLDVRPLERSCQENARIEVSTVMPGNDSTQQADGFYASQVAVWITLRIFPPSCVRTYREGLSAKQ